MINIQNTDDTECFKWFLVRYSNPANYHLERITKPGKEFTKKLGFQWKLETFRKSKKKNFIDMRVFAYENKKKHPIYVSK